MRSEEKSLEDRVIKGRDSEGAVENREGGWGTDGRRERDRELERSPPSLWESQIESWGKNRRRGGVKRVGSEREREREEEK